MGCLRRLTYFIINLNNYNSITFKESNDLIDTTISQNLLTSILTLKGLDSGIYYAHQIIMDLTKVLKIVKESSSLLPVYKSHSFYS